MTTRSSYACDRGLADSSKISRYVRISSIALVHGHIEFGLRGTFLIIDFEIPSGCGVCSPCSNVGRLAETQSNPGLFLGEGNDGNLS